MSTVRYYAQVLGVQVRASLANSMQYRVDFLVGGAISLYWVAWNLIPLLVLFSARTTVAGWDFDAALVVIGWFTALRGLLEGAINPSLVEVVDHIRMGTFDYVLLKPADTQFLVSTARFQPWKVLDVLGGIGVVVYAFISMGYAPSAGDIGVAVAMLGASALVLYSIWILIVSASFWVVRLDNLTYLFTAVFDAGRWPVQVFRGAWRFIFTFVIPIAIMTTYPSMALLGRLDASTAWFAAGGALAFAALARMIWMFAISRYTSASS